MIPFAAYNSLKISYGPLSFYEFEDILENKKKRPIVVEELNKTRIYILAERQLQFFIIEDELYDELSHELISLKMSVVREGCSPVEIEFKTAENHILFKDGIQKVIYSSNAIEADPKELTPIHVITFVDKNNQSVQFSFDRLMWLYHNKQISIHINGDIEPLITYKILYVGKSVGESVLRRFSQGHHKMQRINNKHAVVITNYDKANELVIIPFEVNIMTETQVDINPKLSDEEIGNQFFNHEIGIPQEAFYNDCEKALIKVFDPKYNDEKYKSYPKRSDNGLKKYNIKTISFIIDENIVLSSEGKTFYGITNKHFSIIQVSNNSVINVLTN